MKRITWILLVSLLCCSFSRAEDVKWYGWNEAEALAEEQNKPIMIFVYATWCHLCKRMDTKVFTDEEVAVILNKHFIPVKLDAEYTGVLQKGVTAFTPLELLAELTDNQFRGIPAYVFIPEKSGKRSKLAAGLKDPGEMIELLKKYK